MLVPLTHLKRGHVIILHGQTVTVTATEYSARWDAVKLTGKSSKGDRVSYTNSGSMLVAMAPARIPARAAKTISVCLTQMVLRSDAAIRQLLDITGNPDSTPEQVALAHGLLAKLHRATDALNEIVETLDSEENN